MTWDNDIYTCEICGDSYCVPPYGDENSPVLIVGDYPDGNDLVKAIPFSDKEGTILRTQMGYLGWNLQQFRLCNLWQHRPNKNEACYKHGVETVIKEAKGKKAILFTGAEVVKEFFTKNSMEIQGIPAKEFLSYPLSADIIYCMPKISIVFHGVMGELKLALEKFSKDIEPLFD